MRKNLIVNSRWAPGPDGGPMLFSGRVATYDDLSINGYRTCSISMSAESGMEGINQYDPEQDVLKKKSVTWGYIIRAVEAESIKLAAKFFGNYGELVEASEKSIENLVGYEFSRIMNRFAVPNGAATVMLSLRFTGKVTACTFFAPMAYYG